MLRSGWLRKLYHSQRPARPVLDNRRTSTVNPDGPDLFRQFPPDRNGQIPEPGGLFKRELFGGFPHLAFDARQQFFELVRSSHRTVFRASSATFTLEVDACSSATASRVSRRPGPFVYTDRRDPVPLVVRFLMVRRRLVSETRSASTGHSSAYITTVRSHFGPRDR